MDNNGIKHRGLWRVFKLQSTYLHLKSGSEARAEPHLSTLYVYRFALAHISSSTFGYSVLRVLHFLALSVVREVIKAHYMLFV